MEEEQLATSEYNLVFFLWLNSLVDNLVEYCSLQIDVADKVLDIPNVLEAVLALVLTFLGNRKVDMVLDRNSETLELVDRDADHASICREDHYVRVVFQKLCLKMVSSLVVVL